MEMRRNLPVSVPNSANQLAVRSSGFLPVLFTWRKAVWSNSSKRNKGAQMIVILKTATTDVNSRIAIVKRYGRTPSAKREVIVK